MTRTTFLLSLVCFFLIGGSGRIAADTVYLRVGGQIDNCRVVKKTTESLTLRTPQGRMQVPRSAVRRIKKKESVFDVYDAKYARVDQQSSKSLYGLREWCLRRAGFGEEARALAVRVLEIDPEHAGIRKDLGYIRQSGEWVKLPRFSISVVSKGKTRLLESVRQKFALAVAHRDEIQVRELVKEDSVHSCSLVAKVSVSAGRSVEFYGMKLSKDSVAVSVEFVVKGKLFKNKRMKLRITGKANTATGARDRAVNAAFVSNARKIQAFVDRVMAHRYRAIRAALGESQKAVGSVVPTQDGELQDQFSTVRRRRTDFSGLPFHSCGQ